MIEKALIFALGVLVAALAWLIFLPAFWRRAVRLTRERIERSLPMSLNEIIAEQDRLRAGHAVALRRVEQGIERARVELVGAKVELGERIQREAELTSTLDAAHTRIATLEAELAQRGDAITTLNRQLDETGEARDLALTTISGLEMKCEAQLGRLNAAALQIDEQRRMIDDLGSAKERLTLALEAETQRAGQLRAELQTRLQDLREAERKIRDIETAQEIEKIKQDGAARAGLAGVQPWSG